MVDKMVENIKLILFLNNFLLIYCQEFSLLIDTDYIKTKHFVFWPNATVPFFINPNHFDHEQSLTIMTTLSMFAFKTCLKFAPVMAPPTANQHVLTFVNPDGIRRCIVDVEGHSVDDPHYLIVGYDCLKSPHLEMTVMKALGLPYEHNRHSRDVFIEVLFENIEPGSMNLFTKNTKLPQELQSLPYDYNSVMHFGEREYSKNGHRTIIFKDHRIVQKRETLTSIDLRKIEIIYGPECLIRDRQEKIDMCQEYPGVARRKREADEVNNMQEVKTYEPVIDNQNKLRKKRDTKDIVNNHEVGSKKKRDDKELAEQEHELDKDSNRIRKRRNVQLQPVMRSLRVNRNITPPPENETDLAETLKDLGIEDEVTDIVERVYKVSSKALNNARAKYCNNSKPDLRTGITVTEKNSSDILGIVEAVASYAASMVDNAILNLTVFCENSESIDKYQRVRCSAYDGNSRCRETYRSTKSGRVRYSTKHRPTYFQHTKHEGRGKIYQYDHLFRSGNNTDSAETTTESKTVTESLDSVKSRKKREVKDFTMKRQNGVTETTILENKKRDVEEKLSTVDKVDLTTTKEVNHATDDVKVRSKREIKDIIKLTKDVKNSENLDLNETTVVDSAKVVTDTTISEGMKAIIGDIRKTRTTITEEKSPTDSRRRYLKGRKPRSHLPANIVSKVLLINHNPTPILRSRGDDNQSGEWTPTESAEKYKRKKTIKQDREDELNAEKESEGKESESKESEVKRNRYENKVKEVKHWEKKTKNLPKTVLLTKENVEFYKERRWPGGVVRYIVKEDSTYDIDDLRDRIGEVNRILQKKTCVKLKEITENDANKYDDYLVLDTSSDYVTGRVGGRQHFGSIELFRGNQHKQHTAMMVMAMLGFYFELARHDRDKYVRVHMRHVRPDKLHHFEKIRAEATFDLPYDYESATHPAWQFWRKIGKTGISSVATFKEQDPDSTVMKSLGQNDQLLSNLDIVKINSIYGLKCCQNNKERKENNDTNQSK